MGAGRKPRNFNPNDNFPSPWMASNVPGARNLGKYQLGGVIFGCTTSTITECLSKHLFGLPASHFSYVQNIQPGLPLFLFNYTDKKLHGIFEAASSGKLCIDPYAWTENGSGRTKYPAQVQVLVRLKCEPLSEREFKPIVIDNYYGQAHFWFELDHAQTNRLMSTFSFSAIGPRNLVHQNFPKGTTEVQGFPFDTKKDKNRYPEPPFSTENFTKSSESIGRSSISGDSLCLDMNNQLGEKSTCNQMSELDGKDLIFMKLKELALCRESSDANMIGGAVEEMSEDKIDAERNTNDFGKTTNQIFLDSLDYPSIIKQLCMEMEELKAFKEDQTRKTQNLEKKLAVAEQEIQRLESRCMMVESMHNPSKTLATEGMLLESPEEVHFNLEESIFIVGGYDGSSWSSSLLSFSPSHDALRFLKPMASVRSYAAVAKLNGELYAFGGGTGSTWYDTVESYNAANDQWTTRPTLNKRRGSLAGGVLNEKIFAVGGGNGIDCFSDIEMYDPDIGRWISARSMLQKRFALAAVELNGALYAVGGFNGNEYLKCAERFDPREHSWTRIESMNAKRSCHSLVVLNQKLYAIGGYDGVSMVPTVEIYDPRLGKWMDGASMHHSRGYSAAAVLEDSIYIVGGVKANEDIMGTIECYKDDKGWQETNLKAIGKRCFASAIVLGED